jgi:crotonobetainyl-CoA:carnitine CoA-transferase CaiB-like acyl-CoA transferase
VKNPLEGIRILSLTNHWAGPSAVRFLADLGAQAIKLEAAKRPDPARGPKAGHRDRREYPNDDAGRDPWNRVPRFNERHLGNLDLALDLSHPIGKQVFLDLVRISDVVVENFSLKVMRSLGLEYEVLNAVKPDIILVSMPGFGSSGPWRNYRSYGPTLEYLSGMAALTGYEEGQALPSNILIPDCMGAIHGAGAIMAALYHREQTGEGQHIELAQLEGTLCLMGDALLDTAINGAAPKAMGNRHATCAPHGCYPSKGTVGDEDAWITIAVTSDAEWQALCDAAKKPEWLSDPRFATMSSRKRNENELDAAISEWTAKFEKYQLAHRLQRAGVAAAPVMNARDFHGDPQVLARRMLVPVDHPSAGLRSYHGNTWKLSKAAAPELRPAPTLGQHNRFVLEELLGMVSADVDALEREGVIGTEPLK